MKFQFDWSQCTNGDEWLKKNTCYLSVYGSHAYGTAIETSDLDIRGIVIAPKEYYLGCEKSFEQFIQSNPDLVIFDLKKFFKLAIAANPSVLEILFIDSQDHLFINEIGKTILENRNLFLSQKIKHTFSGYATSQLKRINTHYRWLKNPPTHQPTREEFGLTNSTLISKEQLNVAKSLIQKQIDDWSWKDLDILESSDRQMIKDEFFKKLLDITQWNWQDLDEHIWNAAVLQLGFQTNFIEYLKQEKLYSSASKDWINYQKWKIERNPDRAKLEEKFGYDTKHGMHLVRLMRMCKEILTTGNVVVKRPDAKELIEIRNGSMTYHELVEYAQKIDLELNDLVKVSKLPWKPNTKKIENLCVEILENFLF